MRPSPSRKRSVVKALTYRLFIVCLDFLAIYLFTRKAEVAFGFTERSEAMGLSDRPASKPSINAVGQT
jgi:hypothetical protein